MDEPRPVTTCALVHADGTYPNPAVYGVLMSAAEHTALFTVATLIGALKEGERVEDTAGYLDALASYADVMKRIADAIDGSAMVRVTQAAPKVGP